MSDLATGSDGLAPELNLAGRDDAFGPCGGERLVRGGLVLLVALGAIAGSVDVPGLPAVLALLAAGLALAMTLLAALGLRWRHPPVRPVAVALGLVTLAGAWMIFQRSPFAPSSWQHPLWALAAPVLGDAASDVVPRIGIDPDAADVAVMALLRDALLFWIAYGLAATTAGARQLLTAVATIGVLAAVAVLVLRLGGGSSATAAAPGGGVAGLGMVALLAFWIERRSGAGTVAVATPARIATRAALLQAAPLAGIVLAAAAVVATAGLGGFLIALIGLFGVLLATMIAPGLAQFRRRAGIGFSLCTACVAGALLVGVPIAIHAFGTAAATPGVDTVAIQAISDAPLLGTGAGASTAVLRLYGTATAPGAYLAAMIELGIPAALALTLGCAALFALSALGVWRRRRNAVYACVGVGASLLVASDAIVGQSLANPAVAIVWCVLMGIACAQALRSDERRTAAAA
jgi:hypothetical protein